MLLLTRGCTMIHRCCTLFAECTIASQRVSCLLGDIAQGSITTIRLKARAAALPDTVATLGVVNRVTANGNNDDSCRADDEAAVLVRNRNRQLQRWLALQQQLLLKICLQNQAQPATHAMVLHMQQ
jgi:hypothetical protein